MHGKIPADSGRLAWPHLVLWTLAIAIPSAVHAEVASRDCAAILKDDLPGLDTEIADTVAWMLSHLKPLDEGPAFRDAVRRALGAKQEQPPTVSREGSVCAVCAAADTAVLQGFLRSGLVTNMVQRIRQGPASTRYGTAGRRGFRPLVSTYGRGLVGCEARTADERRGAGLVRREAAVHAGAGRQPTITARGPAPVQFSGRFGLKNVPDATPSGRRPAIP